MRGAGWGAVGVALLIGSSDEQWMDADPEMEAPPRDRNRAKRAGAKSARVRKHPLQAQSEPLQAQQQRLQAQSQ